VRFEDTPFSELLTSNAVFVPVPSSRLLKPHSLWVPFQLARALLAAGFGRDVQTCLSRSIALPKAAWSDAEERPMAQRHHETLAVRKLLFAPTEIVLVDDVVTRGATLLGAASRLRESFPSARISAFAAMRAISAPHDFHGVFDPCVGVIRLRDDGSTTRRP
jgi:predicted amidophosphoribosyltransferase